MHNSRSKLRRALIGVLLGGALFGAMPALAEVGTEDCLGCHDEMAAGYAASLHDKVWQAAGESENGCVACHGPGEQHVDDPSTDNIVSFGKDSAQDIAALSAVCLKCHSGSEELALWQMGKHAKRDVPCSSCHSIHSGYSPLAAMPETCYNCHLDVKLEANMASHHPIKEGKVSCNDCHNPHGSLAEAEIRDDSLNQLCYQCHADKRGPFLWEHAPVEEDCSICHEAHGSRHKKLTTQKTPNLCQNCHERHGAYGKESSFPGDDTTRFFVGRSCLNCHQNIHGSWSANSSRPSRGKVFYY